MIQRIQTVYLFLVFGLMLCMLFLPVAKIEVDGIVIMNWSLNVTCGLSALMALASIFFYKNRKLQTYICYGILLLLVLSYLIILFDFWLPSLKDELTLIIQVPIAFPAFAIVLDILAILAIRKDEKLVRSADRLR